MSICEETAKHVAFSSCIKLGFLLAQMASAANKKVYELSLVLHDAQSHWQWKVF